ncbi:MAG: ABC transporter substrate-binding protein [Oscillospiraceae bacterium]|nr:ABC transporter substrate-binding protein [Oscillospiraceae bacterium]
MRNFEKNVAKMLAFCILLVLFLHLAGSCAQDSSGTTNTPEAPLQNETAAGDDSPEEAGEMGLPPGLSSADMGGKEITLGLLNWHNYDPLTIRDVEVEELTGEAFNDAAYNRNKFMEDTFNCVIKTIAYPTQDSIPGIRNQIKAGDDTLDIVFFRAITTLPLLTGGYLHDLSDIPYVDLDKPWWNKSSIDDMTLGGRVYSLLGDHTMTVLSCVWLTYFNKQLVADLALENPYALVREGKWTFDKMYEMGKIAAADMDGNGKRDENDRWGFMHIDNSAAALYNGFGEKLVSIGADGLPYISLANESAMEKYMHITEILSDHDVFLNAHRRTPNAYDYEAGMFVWGRSLFSLGGVYYGPEMREMEQDFGLLPYPKYNESQEWFNPIHSAAIPLITVPVTNTDLDNMGLFIEAFTYQGHISLRPQFYDVLLQRKVARDNESEEMLNFIFDNICFDIGEAYDFGGIYGQFNSTACSGNMNIASWLEKSTPKIERDIESFVEAMLGVE